MESQNSMGQLQPLLRPKQAAAILSVSERLLARWRVEGRGPSYVRMGHRTVAYHQDALAAWVNANSHT
jgi:predicted DNA-binding transcriptional regulator AlpA